MCYVCKKVKHFISIVKTKSFWLRANARNMSFWISLQLLIIHVYGDTRLCQYWVIFVHCDNSPLPFVGFVQPVAMFPFNHLLNGCEVISRARLATLAHVSWGTGIDGSQGGSIMLHGRRDSFIEIANYPGSDLDTRYSITILLHVYPIGNRGPILCFHEEGLGVQIWQEDVFDDKGILTARFVWRDHTQSPALTQAVLAMNAWNVIGASYDYESGVAYLWHNGNNVEEKYIGRKMELATQFSIRMGVLATTSLQSCFRGRISQLHIYAEALGREDIRGVGGIVNKGNKKPKSSVLVVYRTCY